MLIFSASSEIPPPPVVLIDWDTAKDRAAKRTTAIKIKNKTLPDWPDAVEFFIE